MSQINRNENRQDSDSQRLKVGSNVHVARLKKNGVIVEVMSDARYRVCIGSLAISCKASELAVFSLKQVPLLTPAPIRIPKIKPPPTTLDLHGHTVDEAVRKLDLWLDQAVRGDLSKVKVIHGFGSGRVQRAVHQHLSKLAAVTNFRINPLNAGETEIFL